MANEDIGFARLCPCCLGFVVGVVWGLGLLLLGIVTCYTETYGHEIVRLVGNVYWGYQPGSVGAAFYGLLWGFVDGFIGTAIIAALYNLGVSRFANKYCCMYKKAKAGETAD